MKVALTGKYGLGGTAAWKLGLEESTVWQVISDNLN
jgi:spore germination protein YaaH